MHKFSQTDGSYVRILYGSSVAAALLRDPETRHLAPGVDEATLRLEEAEAESRKAEIGKARAVAQANQVEAALEDALRSLQKLVVFHNGTSLGPLEVELFPGGLTSALEVRHEVQLQVSLEVLRRLKESQSKGAVAVRDAYLATLVERAEELRAVLGLREAAIARLAECRRTERWHRTLHERALAIADGQLRALFPQDRRRRESYAPKLRARSRKGEPGLLDALDEGNEPDDVSDVATVALPSPPVS